MKKLMKSLMLFAAAAMALTSCENEAMNEGIEANETVTMTFVAGAPESRTSVDVDNYTDENGKKIAKYSWNTTGEKLYFLQYGGEKIYKNQSEEGVIAEDGTATFNVTFTNKVDNVSTYSYSAIYPSTNFVAENDNWNSVEVKIPETQVFVKTSYDPAADLMVAAPIVAEYNDAKIHKLQFTRLAAVAKMNIKNIQADEVIRSIKFTLAEGTKFVGANANIDVENGTIVNSGNKNSITLVPFSDLKSTGEIIPVFFTCFPIEYTGDYTLTVDTDKATYSNSGTITTPLAFTAGNVKAFTIKAGERTEKSESIAGWYKISNLSELAIGDQVALVGTTKSGSYSMTGGSGSAAPAVSKVTFNADGSLASVASFTTFNIGKDGDNYILYSGETTTSWLYCTNDNNGVRIGTNTNKTWTITKHSKGSNFEFKHVGTSRYLGIYNDSNWRCYTSATATNFTSDKGTSDIAIYKYGVSGGNEGGGSTEPDEPETPAVVAPTINVDDQTDVPAEGVTNATATVGLGSPVGNWTYTVTSDVAWLTNMSLSGTTLTYTVAKNEAAETRTATVTITAKLSGQDNVTETFKITQAAAKVVEPDEPETPTIQTYTETFANYAPSSAATSYNLSGNFAGVSESGITWTYSGCGNPNQTTSDVNSLKSKGLTSSTGITMGKNGQVSATIPGNVTSVSFYVLTSSKATCSVTITNGTSTTTKTVAKSTTNKFEITDIKGNSGSTTITFKEASTQNRVTIAGLTYTK